MPDAFDDATTVREIAIRLEGKIDALAAKLDGRLDAVMAKIDAGDRESLQLFKLQENELGHLATQVGGNTQRILALEQHTSDFPTVRKLVYSGVGLVLVTVVAAILALVVLAP